MKIAPKITLGYCLIACFVAAVGYVGYWGTRETERSHERLIEDTFPTTEAIQNVRYYGIRITSATSELLFLRSLGKDANDAAQDQDTSEMEELRDKALAPLDQMMGHYVDLVHRIYPEEAEQADRILLSGAALKARSAELIATQNRGTRAALLLQAKTRMEAAETAFLTEVDKALAREKQEVVERHESVDAAITGYLEIIGGFTLLSFLAALTLGTLIARNLSRPIIALKDAALSLGKGDLSVRVHIPSRDEVGILAQSFNDMAQALGTTTVSKAEVDNIIHSMLDSLIVLDVAGRIVRVNEATLHLLGYTEAELLGQPAGLVVQDDFLQGFRAEDYANFAVDECAEAVYRTKDGRLQPILFSAATLRNDNGDVLGMVLVAQDITSLKEAQDSLLHRTQELERTNKELDQFAYVVSHDLKAPLRAIANLSQWIEEDLGDDIAADTRKQMNLLRGRVHRMEGLINGILEYSRIGRTAVQPEEVNTQSLLREITDGLPVPPGYTISVAPDMPRLTTSRVRLGQVFGNLLSNAIKYRSRDDGRVEVAVRDAGDFYEFSVADDGPGIAPEFHEKVFVIFQTLAARDKVESTGIGLTLVKKIVEDQGGRITLESDGAKGSIFRFTWPKTTQEAKTA